MDIRRSKSFLKSYSALTSVQKKRVEIATENFVVDRSNPALRDHPLKGKMKGLRSFSAAWDLRVIYREEGGFITIILMDVGSHNQVY